MNTTTDGLQSFKLGFDIAKGITEILANDSDRVKAIKTEIDAMVAALESGVQDRIIAANTNTCNKFPELFYFAEKNNLIKVTNYEIFASYPLSFHALSLEAVMKATIDLLRSEQTQEKIPQATLEAEKILMGHFVDRQLTKE